MSRINATTLFFFSLLVLALALLPTSLAITSSQLELSDGSPITLFNFDWRTQTTNGSINNSFGSDSYMDLSPTNPDVFLRVCHPNLTEGKFLDVVYATKDARIISSILHYKPYVSYTNPFMGPNGLYYCTRVNVDFSSDYAVYPGYVRAVIIEENATNLDYSYYNGDSDYVLLSPMNLLFAGQYQMGVNVVGPPKQYLFTTVKVFDAFGHLNPRHERKLLTSLMAPNNSVYLSARLAPGEVLPFTGNIVGGETVIINDLLALELKQYRPCDPINASGYYMMNSSKFNHNETCIVIENMENVVINFGGEQIDGDGLENGSLKEPVCSVTIENSRDITLENFRVYEFYYGICIKNSSVTLYGDGAKFNVFGAIAFENSYVTLVDISFDNINSEIIAQDNTTIRLVQLNFSSALIHSTFTDAIVRSVRELPPLLNVTDMMHIDQFIQYESNGPLASAQVSFYYQEPMPNGVVTNNLSIYKFNGSYVLTNITRTDPVTNISYIELAQQWTGGDWEKLFTLISPSESLIVGPVITNFSVFAPFGFSTLSKGEEEPGDGDEAGTVPEPDPDPKPEAGSTQGGGGTPARADYSDVIDVGPLKPIVIELNLPQNITLMQGEAGEIFFNISNKGEGTPTELIISPMLRPGWENTNGSIVSLVPGETREGSFQLSPYELEIPGKYSMQVKVFFPARDGEAAIASDVMDVYVLPRGTLKRIRVLEYPPEIIVPPFSEQDISFLISNIGDAYLQGITVKLEKSDCLLDLYGENALGVGQTDTLKYHFVFGDKNECKYNLKFYDGDELVGFVPLTFIVTDKFTKEDIVKLSFMSVFILAWTALTAFVVSRRRKRLASLR